MKIGSFLLRAGLCPLPCLLALGLLQPAWAATSSQPQITQSIDETNLVTLTGQVPAAANAANDRGPVADTLELNHMTLELARPPALQKALDAYVEAEHTPGSANFHHWLTAAELGEQYGPDPADIQTISNWLEMHGLQVDRVSASGTAIDFSGTAAQVTEAFKTEIHNLEVNGKSHIANMQNPQIPAALAVVVSGIVSLNDFRPHPAYEHMARSSVQHPGVQPGLTAGDGEYLVVPADLAQIYNFNPAYAKGYTGKGETVAVLEDTNVYSAADVATFRKTFGLSKYQGTFTQIHPEGCTNPGVTSDDVEATIDVEWSGAAAPDAAIELASCADTNTAFGVLTALQGLLDLRSPPPIVSLSYLECEAGNGPAMNRYVDQLYQQAASEGVSVFVASGDSGAAGCDDNEASAVEGISVSGLASTPNNVAVGGTDYSDTFSGANSQYWASQNSSTYRSAKSYIPEIPWNDSCASVLIAKFEGYAVTYGRSGFCNSATGEVFLSTAAGSGGPSGCAYGETSPLANTAAVSGTCKGYAKPSWQRGVFGLPNDGVRDLPDVSLFAANGVWGHYYINCFSDPNNGGVPCTGNPAGWTGAGGTSFSSPIVAGVQALVDQLMKGPQGNPNYVYYAIAAKDYGSHGNSACNSSLGQGSCTFHDVTLGDNDVNCLGDFNCYLPSGTNGVLSVSDKYYEKAYGTNVGWDFATGIGTINVYNLLQSWEDFGGGNSR